MTAEQVTDGRRARGERTRGEVARAVLELLEEGNLRPTRREIADRAGVSLRLVHHHFREREELYAAAGRLQNQRISRGIAGIDLDAAFDARVRAFASARASLLEAITPVRRAAQLEEPFSSTLRATLAAWRLLKREQVAQVFAPELAATRGRKRADITAAAACAASWSAWNELRVNQGLERSDAERVMKRALVRLLTGGRT